jgi:hypothetical protein
MDLLSLLIRDEAPEHRGQVQVEQLTQPREGVHGRGRDHVHELQVPASISRQAVQRRLRHYRGGVGQRREVLVFAAATAIGGCAPGMIQEGLLVSQQHPQLL